MPTASEVRVLLCYKNFAANQNVSHIGLGVSSVNTAKVLKRHGVRAEVRPILGIADIIAVLKADPRFTHVVIAAPWIPTAQIASLILAYPDVEFMVNVHSNVGFLQADTNGVKLIREYIDLEQGNQNFRISANSRKGTLWLREAYQCPASWLPNLYYVDQSAKPHRPLWNGGKLRIGAFGATRPLKNLMTAAGAALVIANQLKAETQFWISSGRMDGGQGVVSSITAMLAGVPNIQLKLVNWQSWPQFRDTVRNMHLMLQVSYSESFNMVSADGVVEGVPSVVSDAIDWLPDYWKAEVDQPNQIARIGRQLLSDPNAGVDGLQALEQHNKDGLEDGWSQLLEVFLRYQSPFSGILLV